MKKSALDRMLAKHLSTCTMHNFNERADRHCSCGRDEAIKEVEEYKSWKSAVEEACIAIWVPITTAEETVKELIRWNNIMLLDPEISQEARDLIEKHGGKRLTSLDAFLAAYDVWASDTEPFGETFGAMIKARESVLE